MHLSPRKALVLCLLLSLFLLHVPLGFFLWFAGDSLVPLSPRVALPRVVTLVDLAPPEREEVPENPSAQALYNTKVKEETTAGATGRGGKGRAAPPRIADSPPRHPAAPEKRKPVARSAPSPEPETSPSSLKDELLALRGEEKARERENLRRFESKTTAPAVLGTGFGEGSPDDFLPSYKVGSRTFVNALANPRVAYFVELKRKFKLTWNPLPPLRGEMHRITRGKVEVVWGLSVNERGGLADLVLIRGSSLDAFDAEARRTILANAPFTSPPGDLLTADRQVHMAWTFVVYL